MVRTALNTHVSWWRRRRREVAWKAGIDPARDGPDGPGLDALVLAALKDLPRRQREVVALRVFLDLDTVAERIATTLLSGKPTGCVAN